MLRLLTVIFTSSAILLSSTTTVLAQEAEQSGLVQQSQTSIFEYILVAALFGLALFAICRTSHRS